MARDQCTPHRVAVTQVENTFRRIKTSTRINSNTKRDRECPRSRFVLSDPDVVFEPARCGARPWFAARRGRYYLPRTAGVVAALAAGFAFVAGATTGAAGALAITALVLRALLSTSRTAAGFARSAADFCLGCFCT